MIVVPNASFESAALGFDSFGAQIAEWTGSGTGRRTCGLLRASSFSSSGTMLPAPAEGEQCLSLNTTLSGQFNLTTSAPVAIIQADTIYTLTVAFGVTLFAPNDGIQNGNPAIEFLADDAPFPGSRTLVNAFFLPRGSFADYAASFSAPAGSDLVGKALTLRVSLTGFGFTSESAAVDNVRLTAVAVPEPAAAVLLLTALPVCLHARRRAAAASRAPGFRGAGCC